MSSAPKPKRRKIVCSTCGKEFDSDYRKKHEANFHQGKPQRVHDKDAPINPFIASIPKGKYFVKIFVLKHIHSFL